MLDLRMGRHINTGRWVEVSARDDDDDDDDNDDDDDDVDDDDYNQEPIPLSGQLSRSCDTAISPTSYCFNPTNQPAKP